MIVMRVFIILLLFLGFSYGDSVVKYATNFIGFSAGVVKVDIKSPQNLECEGKTGGLFSMFYNYKFKFVENGDNYTLEEEVNGKKRVYSKDEILKKKAWIPVFISMLTKSNYELGNPIKVGNILIIPEENVQNEIYFFKVKNSHNVKRVVIWYDSAHYSKGFPKLIRIETKEANIDLKRL